MNQLYQSESRGAIPNQAHHLAPRLSHRLSLLALFAIAGKVLLLASAWLLPLVSEYSLVGDNISELVLGRLGFIQTLAFLVSGLGTLGLAYAIWKLGDGSWGFSVGAPLVALYGAGAILSAIFPTDRIDSPADIASLSTTGLIHSGVALISFLCIIVGMFVLTRTFFRRGSWWRPLSPWWLMLFPAGALSLLFAQNEGPWVGILQRAQVTIIVVWLMLVALNVRTIAEDAELRNS